MTEQDAHRLKTFINEIASTGAIALITLEPMNGLEIITEQDCQEFASLCLEFEELGLGVMVRFAHEMNGSWYPGPSSLTFIKKSFACWHKASIQQHIAQQWFGHQIAAKVILFPEAHLR